MTPGAIIHAANLLREARACGATLDALPDACRPATLADAHAIQAATAARLGEAIGGWKVGATPDGGVARGALFRSRMYASASSVRATEVPLLGIEAEIAFRFEHALPARGRPYAYEEVAEAVIALPAIEIVDSRFRGYPAAPLLDRVADCMSNGAFVYGVPVAQWRALDLVNVDVELRFDDAVVVQRTGGHPTKDPLLPAVALANDLRAEDGVAAGVVVTTGTYTGLHHAKAGQTVTAAFRHVGSVQVTFE